MYRIHFYYDIMLTYDVLLFAIYHLMFPCNKEVDVLLQNNNLSSRFLPQSTMTGLGHRIAAAARAGRPTGPGPTVRGPAETGAGAATSLTTWAPGRGPDWMTWTAT